MCIKKKNPNMARWGKNNGRWKGGISKTYYRRVAGAGPRQIVHHKKKSKKNPKRGDLEVLNNRGNSAIAKHNKLHPEKGGYHPKKKRFKKIKR